MNEMHDLLSEGLDLVLRRSANASARNCAYIA
jgi:hypothetical protein